MQAEPFAYCHNEEDAVEVAYAVREWLAGADIEDFSVFMADDTETGGIVISLYNVDWLTAKTTQGYLERHKDFGRWGMWFEESRMDREPGFYN